MKKIESALKNVEEGKMYYHKPFAGGAKFWCKLLKKGVNEARPSEVQVQELKPEDDWNAPTGRVLNVGLNELYYHWLDDRAIL